MFLGRKRPSSSNTKRRFVLVLLVFVSVLFVIMASYTLFSPIAYDNALTPKLETAAEQEEEYRVDFVLPEYESLAYVTGEMEAYTYPPPLRKGAPPPTQEMTPLVQPSDTTAQECTNPTGAGITNAETWVDYVVIEPETKNLHQLLARFLYYVARDRAIAQDCRTRVFVVSEDAKRDGLQRVCDTWHAVSGVPLEVIEAKKAPPNVLLREALAHIVEGHAEDIVFFADVRTVVPPGFANIVRSHTKRGAAIFMPVAKEFVKPSKKDFNISNAVRAKVTESTVLNVGAFAQDALGLGLYTGKDMVPIKAAVKKEYFVEIADVYGLLKPLNRLATNEVKALKCAANDEKVFSAEELERIRTETERRAKNIQWITKPGG